VGRRGQGVENRRSLGRKEEKIPYRGGREQKTGRSRRERLQRENRNVGIVCMCTLLSISNTFYYSKLDIPRTYFHLHNIISEKQRLNEVSLFLKQEVGDLNLIILEKLLRDTLNKL